MTLGYHSATCISLTRVRCAEDLLTCVSSRSETARFAGAKQKERDHVDYIHGESSELAEQNFADHEGSAVPQA